MNAQRKRIIITEIQYWKQNKLLPEHYCDFLITLYARGEEDGTEEMKGSKGILEHEKKTRVGRVIAISLLTILVFGGMFLLKNYSVWPMSAAAVLATILLIISLGKSRVSSNFTSLLYILSAFLLLGLSLKVWMIFFETETMLLIGLLVLNCVLWLFAGRLLKLLYFTISGSVGLLLIIGFLFLSM
ncbi:hypothetical protein [Sporosarcina sp. Te-1]|uniref:hypothetical protein n=1 Tax=Sporosarcina sp. Te-1 TaxID=2818390 RepID=UPI001A9EFBA8|nr:hypothetical protein [Sporosarcina sp. Te-1]QTD41670.1 hypothetical protein J3U78_02100 [Sporosarcina sp. Te-1]